MALVRLPHSSAAAVHDPQYSRIFRLLHFDHRGCLRHRRQSDPSRFEARNLENLSRVAVWFAPLAVFWIERSALALVAAVILTTAFLWERPGFSGIPSDSKPPLRQFPTSMLIALLAQLTAAGLLVDRLFPAIACALGAVSLLFSQIHPPRRSMGTLFMLTCLALFLTLGGLSRFLELGGASTLM